MKWVGAVLACFGVAAPGARAARTDWLAEARTSTLFAVANANQFGAGDADGPCGKNTLWDGGQTVDGSLALFLSGPQARHMLSLSLGYVAPVCTPILRRPVLGLAYRGEHAFSQRTRVTGFGQATLDVLDRSLDVRSGQSAAAGSSAAGQAFVQAQAGFELAHQLSWQNLLRASVAWRGFEILAPLVGPTFSTLGPMQSFLAGLSWQRQWTRQHTEAVVRYRVSHLFPGTLWDVLPRNQVVPAHDLFVGGGYGVKLDPRFSLRAETGVALATQAHLCTPIDPTLRLTESCSIDQGQGQQQPRPGPSQATAGIRGFENPPWMEAQFAKTWTATWAGEVSLGYTGPLRRFEFRLGRSYEPDPYAGALTLWDRASTDFAVWPSGVWAVYGSAQFLRGAVTSPGRVSIPEGRNLDQPVSPQNRELLLFLWNAGASREVGGLWAVFAEANLFAMTVAGVQVSETTETEPAAFVSGFPLAGQATPTVRFSLLFGLRAQWTTFPNKLREAERLKDVRNLP